MDLGAPVHGFDRLQRRLPWLGLPYAVIKKFGDDQAGDLAALLAYYAFVAVFPLLLSFVTLLGLILRGDPPLQRQLLHSVLVEFPVIGDQLRLHGLPGSWWTLVVSVGLSLWGARGVASSAQNAFNHVWNVPIAHRPGFWPSLGRSFALLGVMALAVLVTGFLTGVSGFGPIGTLMRIGAFVLGTVINVALFSLAFRLATAREVVTRHLLPGAAVSAVLWQLLLAFGGLLIAHQVRHAQSVYGVFGVVLGLLGWLHLQAQITLYAVEFDNVRVRRLWPRSVAQPPLTRADKHAYDAYAQTQRRRPDEEERIDVTFTDNDPSAPPQDAEPDPK